MFAKVRRQLPEYLTICTEILAVRIATDDKGFYPITWAVMIFVTTISLIVTISLAILKFIWSLIGRIPLCRG